MYRFICTTTLSAALLSTSVFAAMPGESRYEFRTRALSATNSASSLETAENALAAESTSASIRSSYRTALDNTPTTANEEPKAGWVSQAANGGTQVNWLRYHLALGDDFLVPFYILSTNIDPNDEDDIEGSLLDNKAGILNLKWADESAITGSEGGLCDFSKSAKGGCYFTYEAGIKAQQLDDESGNTDYEAAYYLGGGFDLEFPVYSDTGVNTPAGRLIIGASLNAIHTDSEAFTDVFLRSGETGKVDLDDTTGFVDLRIGFNITGKISVEAGGVLWSSSDTLEDNTYFKFNYKISDL